MTKNLRFWLGNLLALQHDEHLIMFIIICFSSLCLGDFCFNQNGIGSGLDVGEGLSGFDFRHFCGNVHSTGCSFLTDKSNR